MHCVQMQLVDNLGEIHSLFSGLDKALDKDNASSFSLSVDQVLPGLICCASVDDQWFRVLVLEPPASSSPSSLDVSTLILTCIEFACFACSKQWVIFYLQVKVEYLDYGGTDRVAVSCLRQLPDTFRHLPFQGISSSLCSESSRTVLYLILVHSYSHSYSLSLSLSLSLFLDPYPPTPTHTHTHTHTHLTHSHTHTHSQMSHPVVLVGTSKD